MYSVRVATYNIHKCRGLDGRRRPKRIADVLGQINADIVALQEVVGMDELEHERNQVRAIAEELGFDFHIGENRRLRGGAYGNAVLSRLPMTVDRNHDLTWKSNEPRGCLQVKVALDQQSNVSDHISPDAPDAVGHPDEGPGPEGSASGLQEDKPRHWLDVFNVHLGTGFFERRYQARRLLDVVNNEETKQSSARIVLGDFNEWTRGLATHLLSGHFVSAEPQQRLGRARSYPGVLPLLHLDHIYYDSSLELVNIAVHRSRLALVASDHLPVVAEFRVGEERG